MKSICLILALFVLCSIQVCSSKVKKPMPNIHIPDYMKILGVTQETVWNKKKFLTFHDIRYAQPLSDEMRFLPPTPYLPGEDEVYDGTKNIGDCPSLKSLELYELENTAIQEDCLFLTVSTKNISANATVMVHLGGYDLIKEENTNDLSHPGYLLEEDIVLVSVQYRVGVFGFLSSMTNEIPGNVGILDVIEALRWVQKYISHFGGNPNNVTIFGQYHSAAIIHILTMTPLLEKESLFHKVIYQSGSALLPNIINKDPLEMVKQIAKSLKIHSEDISEISRDIKTASTVEILRAYKSYVNNYDDAEHTVPFIVVGDPNGVLPEEPKALLKKRKYRVYPTIGGVVEQPSICALDFLGNLGKNPTPKSTSDSSEESDEKDFVTKKRKHKNSTLEEDIAEGANIFKDVLILEVPANGEQAEYISELFPKKIFTANFIKSLAPTVIDIYSIPIKDATLNALKHNTAKGGKSYLYAFNYNPEESRLQCQDNVYVVQLTDDDVFLFPQESDSELKNLNKRETRLARMMVELWTSFAATGKPEAHSVYDWPQMQLGLNGPYFIIDSIHKVGFDYTEEYFSGLRAQRNNIEVVDL